jgi:hypothetical protein
MERERRRGGLVWPAILILVGAVLLLNNLGWTAISVWDLLRLWPVLLIAIGLDLLIGRRSAWGAMLALFVILGLLAGGLWLISSPGPIAEPAREQVTQSLQGASRANVEIDFAAGQLRISSGAAANQLLEGTVQLNRGERLEQSAQVVDGTLSAQVQSQGQWVTPLVVPVGQPGWELALSPDIPLQLVVKAGVGDASLDLRRLALTGLTSKMGVGRTTVTLPEQGTLEARLSSGVGELVVRVPPTLAVRVHPSPGLGTISVPTGYQHSGDVYTSPGYASAQDSIDLWVDNGVGLIRIEEYTGE